MKTTFIILLSLLSISYSLNAQNEQPPQAFNYQAIARDNLGAVLPNKQIGIRIGIIDNSASGSLLYSETFTVTTNQFGLFTINIGMTIGLAPVIGIPLPFISYGGSSLWAFTILLFIFLKLDANRNYFLFGIN